MEKSNEIYLDINPDIPVSEIESLCMSCGQNGTTRILLTKIPYFRDIILMAFDCTHCGYRNSEVQSASNLADYGIKFELKIVNQRDLNRRIVKTEFAEISIPYCGLEIPSKTQKGKLSTVEGYLSTARDDLKKAFDSGVYDSLDENAKEKILDTINKLNKILDGSALPVEMTLVDPSGNSYIENPYAPNKDVYCNTTHFIRTKEMSELMGYSYHNEVDANLSKNVISKNININDVNIGMPQLAKKHDFEVYKSKSTISAHLMDMTKSIGNDEGSDAICLPEICSSCFREGENRVCVITIPFFKELIISCFTCNKCTFKHTEVRGGGGIADKGTKITLNVKTPEDLNRDLFKSETSAIFIPEIDINMVYGTLGSMFTTVEGVIEKLISNLREIPFVNGDSSADTEDVKKLKNLISNVENLLIDFKPFTLILDDPTSNSFIFTKDHEHPDNDKQLLIEEYERTYDQNEDLGLNDIKVENYHEDYLKEKKLEEANKISTIVEEEEEN